jgi:hypothetical protein
MRYKAFLIAGSILLAFVGINKVGATMTPDNREDAAAAPARVKLSETDIYLDLNSGKSFKFIYDGLNDIYNRDDLFGLDLYVNTNTKDTLWLDEAINVNHALLRDGAGKYRIDPMKVKRDGNSYRVVRPLSQ